ncbi:MAG: glycosyltransferase [Eubacteriales bacterium]
MENNAPLVSIVCDTYNHAPFIRDALEGFLAQKTDFPFEIIVHDDASTDGTADIILAYEREHPHIIRCICRTENIYSRDPKILEHYVFPHARGKYIAICEGDDFWTSPDKLQKQVSYLEAHPECTLCVCAGDLVDAEGNKTGSVAPYPTERDVPTDELIRGGGGFVATASIVAPTSLAKNRAAFCDMSDVDDAVLQIWFASNGVTHYFAESMCAYRQAVPGSWTETFFSSRSAARIRHHEGLIRALEAFDKDTQGKYHDAVEYCLIQQQWFEVLRLKNDVVALNKQPYRAQYKALPWRRRVRMWLAHLKLLRA